MSALSRIYPFFPQSEFVERVSADCALRIWENPGADCLLFYPGSLLEPGHYEIFIGALLEAGFSVAGIHLAGHGQCMDVKRFTFHKLLEQGLAAENWLLENKFKKIAACGHSQGGILALAHAAASRSCSAAFSICAAFPQTPGAASLTLFKPLAHKRAAIMKGVDFLAAYLPRLPIPLPFYLSLSRITKGKLPDARMGFGRGRLSYPLEYLASLFNAEIPARLNCPYALFSALDDALFTPGLTLETFNMIEAPEKHLIWLRKGGHMGILSLGPAMFAARKMASLAASAGLSLACRAKI